MNLTALATILADWLEPAPNIPAIYLFGSRVRGDHRPDSDVDIRMFVNEWRNLKCVDVDWWSKENETDFADLKEKLPGPLSLHREAWDYADEAIREGGKKPKLVVRRVICVWTPPKK